MTPTPLPKTLDGTGYSWASVSSSTCIFVGVPVREQFDQIELPAQDMGIKMMLNVGATPMRDEPRRLLVKTQEKPRGGGVTVIFQHWGRPVDGCPLAAAAEAAHAARLTERA